MLLRELLTEMGSSYGTVFVRKDCDPSVGIELLAQSDMFAAEPQGRVIRRDSMANPERHEIKKWQVLLAGAGTLGKTELYGRAIIADDRLSGKCVGPDAMSLTFKEPSSDFALFAYAFLAGPTGVGAIRSTSYGTKILRFREDLLGSLPIPEVEAPTCHRVANLIRRCVQKRESYLVELKAARAVVESLPEMRDAHAMCSQRRARAVVWRGALPTLVGRTYASTGDALQYLGRAWPGRLGDLLLPNGLFYGLLRKRTPCAEGQGVAMIGQRDVMSIRQIPEWIAVPRISRASLFADPGSLVMSAVGGVGEGHSLGSVAIVSPRIARFAFSQHLLRIQPVAGYGAELHAYLSTTVGRSLLRSTVAGTIVLQMRLDFLRMLPAPLLDNAQRGIIAAHHARAINALDSADEAEAEAIRIVEEEVLPPWLI
jgi:hypothetical protein